MVDVCFSFFTTSLEQTVAALVWTSSQPEEPGRRFFSHRLTVVGRLPSGFQLEAR